MRLPLLLALCGLLSFVSIGWLVDAASRAPVSLLVVEHPMPDRVDAVAIHGGGGANAERELAALAMWREGRAGRIVAMGGPLPLGDRDVTYAGAVQRRLREVGAPPDAVQSLPVGASSGEELLALRGLAEREGWTAVALATSRWHSRRVALLAGQVFDGSGVDWRVVVPANYGFEPDRWWEQPRASRLVTGEWLKIGMALAFPIGGAPPID